MISVEGLAGGYGKKMIVEDISLKIEKGEFFALLGPNGSGKTTLFKLITGQVVASKGDIYITGKAMSKLTKLEKAKKVAVLSQEVQMTFDYTVEEIISLGRYPHQKGMLKMLSVYDREVIEAVMKITQVERYRKTQFRLLSGGEKQRVLLAKALAQEPEILMLDEPTNHLDIKHTFEMLDLLKEWQRTKGLTIFAILHDLNVASLYADRVALLYEGTFLEVGDVDTLRKEEQLKKVYEVEVKAQSHPLVPKPQLHMTPKYTRSPNTVPFFESFQIERGERAVHLKFNEPQRTFSNASIGEGLQWLKHFCLVVNETEKPSDNKVLLDWMKGNDVPFQQAAGICFTVGEDEITFIEQSIGGMSFLFVVVVKLNSSKNQELNALHLFLFMDGYLPDKALFDWYMTVTEIKVNVCQRLRLDSLQSEMDVLLLAGNQKGDFVNHEKHKEDFKKVVAEAFIIGIKNAIAKGNVIKEGVKS